MLIGSFARLKTIKFAGLTAAQAIPGFSTDAALIWGVITVRGGAAFLFDLSLAFTDKAGTPQSNAQFINVDSAQLPSTYYESQLKPVVTQPGSIIQLGLSGDFTDVVYDVDLAILILN